MCCLSPWALRSSKTRRASHGVSNPSTEHCLISGTAATDDMGLSWALVRRGTWHLETNIQHFRSTIRLTGVQFWRDLNMPFFGEKQTGKWCERVIAFCFPPKNTAVCFQWQVMWVYEQCCRAVWMVTVSSPACLHLLRQLWVSQKPYIHVSSTLCRK